MCTPSTHCHIIWPAKAHRGKPTLVPLHFAMFDCLDGRQKSPPPPPPLFFNQSMKVGKGRRREKKKVQIPQVFFSPFLGIAVRSFRMNEWHSSQAALELHVCGDNVAVLCCSKNDGQYPPAAGPQGNQCFFLTSHTCHWAGNGELGILGFILPAVTKSLCEPWVPCSSVSGWLFTYQKEQGNWRFAILTLPGRAQCMQQSSNNFKCNFCKDLKDRPRCLHGRVILYVNACVHAYIYIKG